MPVRLRLEKAPPRKAELKGGRQEEGRRRCRKSAGKGKGKSKGKGAAKRGGKRKAGRSANHVGWQRRASHACSLPASLHWPTWSAPGNSPSKSPVRALLERFNRNVEMRGVHDTVALELTQIR